jgi:hypothetical protein
VNDDFRLETALIEALDSFQRMANVAPTTKEKPDKPGACTS